MRKQPGAGLGLRAGAIIAAVLVAKKGSS